MQAELETISRLDQSIHDTRTPLQINLNAAQTSSEPLASRLKGKEVPRLGRVGGQALTEQDLNRRRFGIVIRSVYYEPGPSGSLICAVLLRMTFRLPAGNKLKFALVPLSARPIKSEDQEPENSADSVEIDSYHPSDAQLAGVSWVKGTKEVYLKPQVSVSALGNNVSVDGVGIKKQYDINHIATISLKPAKVMLQNRPTRLEWRFEDEHGVFYPSDIDMLIIIENSTPTPELSFPFELRLEHNLTVDIHRVFDGITKFVRMVAGRRSEREEWFFNIRGKYKPTEAEEALRRAKESPESIGLHAALKEWLVATHQK